METLVDEMFLIVLYICVFFPRWKRQGKGPLLTNTLMYLYLGLLLRITLMPIITSLPYIFTHPHGPLNLIPFAGVTENRAQIIIQIGLNVVLTVPFGFLFPLIFKNRKKGLFLQTVFATFLLSLSIETLQPFLSTFRVADVTDLITNTLGGALGYVIYLIFKSGIVKVSPSSVV